MTTNPNKSLTIVTGCDSTHAKSQLNFLASAKKFEPNTRVIVYDLGMRPRQLRKLKKKFDYEIRTFDYAKYPSFFNIKVAAGEFGWKPVIIEEVARDRDILRTALAILDGCYEIHAGVQRWIDETA